MTCPRGAASPDTYTQRRLFSASAGYCQNPSCSDMLFIDLPDKNIHIAEMAHICAAQDGGPRGNAQLTSVERGSFDNLILLCATCHTIVDKAPLQFPHQMMLAWKRNHATKLQGLFGITVFQNRPEARQAIEPYLQENHGIFDQYGPHIEDANNPESGASERWQRKMVTRILPNNRRILAQLDANRGLWISDEGVTVELFRQHVDDLEVRHFEANHDGGAIFPSGMTTILKD